MIERSNQSINEAVARKLFGDNVCHYSGHVSNECYKKEGLCSWPPNYCTSIAAAWEIVEQLSKLGTNKWLKMWSSPVGFTVQIMSANTDKELALINADTAPMAIALAFLKLS